jgi:hypothetical protein
VFCKYWNLQQTPSSFGHLMIASIDLAGSATEWRWWHFCMSSDRQHIHSAGAGRFKIAASPAWRNSMVRQEQRRVDGFWFIGRFH